MNTIRLLLCLPFLVIMAFAPSGNSGEVQVISKNNNHFAFDLYEKVQGDQKGNLFFSPFSISTALSMTYAGSAGETEEEMMKALHFAPNTADFHLSYGEYLEKLSKNSDGNIKLRIANRLWAEENFEFQKEFIDINKRAYNAPVEKVSFLKDPEGSRGRINSWVENKTEDRIKDLLKPGTITTDTRLVLTNAIYFKGDWEYQFKKSKTEDKKFYLKDGSHKKTAFMQMEGSFDFYEDELMKIIKIPYKGKRQSMVVVLPNSTEDLREVEKSMDHSVFDRVFSYNQPQVILALPKFKMTLPLGLNSYLKSMGMTSAFGSANFSKMTQMDDLFISDVIHKAFIEVNEEGTEAAAATAVVMSTESMEPHEPPKPKKFIADHPFLFYIIDDETRAILFMGRLMEPITM